MAKPVTSTKEQIKRLIPNAQDILVKVERDHNFYRSKILLKVPGKTLHAEKKARCLWQAVERSTQAIRKQIDRIKAKQQGKFLPRVWNRTEIKNKKNHDLDTH